jgi:hypothetical protein
MKMQNGLKRETIVKTIIATAIFALGFDSLSFAQGTVLTFQGQVTSVSGDTSLADSSGLYPNQTFDFTLLINSAQTGTYVDENGVTQSINTMSDPTLPGFYENAFYAAFENGNRMWNPAFASNGYGSANYGSSTAPVFPLDPLEPLSDSNTGTGSPWGALIMASGDGDNAHWFFEVSYTADTLDAANPLNWRVGEIFDVINKATLDGQFSQVNGSVTLTGISPEVSPVPEPSAFALLGLGTAAILIRRRK